MGKTKRYPSGLCSKDFCFNLRLIVCIKKCWREGIISLPNILIAPSIIIFH
jgi:hypothetical protein